MSSMWRKLREQIFSRYYVALLLIYFIGLLPIIRANRSYLDDLGRSLHGYADWISAVRPLAELFAWIFYLGRTTVDASPFTQILAVAAMAVTSLLLLDALRVKLSWPSLICTVPVGLSPYGLENLSYKFDSPYMALALMAAVLPCCLARLGRRPFVIAASMCLFCSASLYQPALGAYLCVILYASLTELASRIKLSLVLRRLGLFLLPFFLGVGAYRLQAPLWFLRSQYEDYVSAHASVPSLAALPTDLAENVMGYLKRLWSDWDCNGLGLLMAGLFLAFALHLFFRWLRHARLGGSATVSASRLLLIPALLFCLLLSPFGVQFALSQPIWAPRTFMGFGVLMSVMLLSLYSRARGRFLRRLAWAAQGLVLIQLLVFANVYGNLLDAQNQWELSRLSMLARDLNSYIKETGSSAISFVGSVGLSPLAVNPARKYPLLERLVTVPLTRDWRWGYEQLITFGVKVERRPMPENLDPADLIVFLENPNYLIQRAPDDTGIVTFLPPPAPKALKRRPARIPVR